VVMNKNADGTTTTSLSPTANVVSGKAAQLVLSGKSITNTYAMGGKPTYTVVNSTKSSVPKVIVQSIDHRNFMLKEQPESSIDRIPEHQRITENTPIDFMPVAAMPTQSANYPKVIIQKTMTAASPKQIKLKLGTNLMSPKIIKGPIPSNLKIQRNINTKNFTILNSSQLVQLQQQQASIPIIQQQQQQIAQMHGSEKVDWEQELDDVANRTKDGIVGKSLGKSNGAGAIKKMRMTTTTEEEVVQDILPETESVIVETVEIDEPTIVFGELRESREETCE